MIFYYVLIQKKIMEFNLVSFLFHMTVCVCVCVYSTYTYIQSGP